VTRLRTVDAAVTIGGSAPDAIYSGVVNANDGDIARQLTLRGGGDYLSTWPQEDLATAEVVVTLAVDGGSPVPVLTGPIVSVTRSIRTFSLEANDRAHWGLAPYRVASSFTIPADTELGDAVNILTALMGLATTADDDLVLPRPLAVLRGEEPWRVVKDLCTAAGRLVHFDGAGELVLRVPPGQSDPADWTLGVGELLSEPMVRWDTAGYRTAVDVIGHLPCDEIVYARSGAADSSGRWALEVVDTDAVTTWTAAKQFADEQLASHSLTNVAANLSVITNPDLDISWLVDAGGVVFKVDAFSFPLTGGAASLGVRSRVV
jgi:hypothetical protein